jgi:hypothetical protein
MPWAPILTRQFATSTTSGSREAFSISVSPVARLVAHEGGMGRPDGHLGKRNTIAFQAARRPGDDIAALQLNRSTEAFQRQEVQINGAGADGAAAGVTPSTGRCTAASSTLFRPELLLGLARWSGLVH